MPSVPTNKRKTLTYTWIPFLVFSGITALLRFPSFYPNVLTADEAYYLSVSDSIIKGNFFTTDFLIFRFVTGTILCLYEWITGHYSFLFIHLLGASLVLLTAFFIYKIIYGNIYHRQGGIAAGVLYIILVSTPWYRLDCNSEILLNFISVLCIFFWLKPEQSQDRTFYYDITIGILIGLGLLEKLYGVVILILFLGVVFVWGKRYLIRLRNIFLGLGIVGAIMFIVSLIYPAVMHYAKNFFTYYVFYLEDSFHNLFSYLNLNNAPVPNYFDRFYLPILPGLLCNFYVPALMTIVIAWNRKKYFYVAEENKFYVWIFFYFVVVACLIPLTGKLFFHYFWLLGPSCSICIGYAFSLIRRKIYRWLLTAALFIYPFIQTVGMLTYLPSSTYNVTKKIFSHNPYHVRLRENWLNGAEYEKQFIVLINQLHATGEKVLILGEVPELYLKSKTRPFLNYLFLDIPRIEVHMKGNKKFSDKIKRDPPVVIFDILRVAEDIIQKETLLNYYYQIKIGEFTYYISKRRNLEEIKISYTICPS